MMSRPRRPFFPRTSCPFRGLAALFCALAALGAVNTAAAAEKKAGVAQAGTFKIVSFNVRNSNAQDGENAWPKRIDLFFDTVVGFNADLIGFQEVLAIQRDELEKRLPAYAF